MHSTIKLSALSAILILAISQGPAWSEPAIPETGAQAHDEAVSTAPLEPEPDAAPHTSRDGDTAQALTAATPESDTTQAPIAATPEGDTTQTSHKTQAEPGMEAESMARFEVTPDSQSSQQVQDDSAAKRAEPTTTTAAETNQPLAETQAQTQSPSRSEATPERESKRAEQPNTQPEAQQDALSPQPHPSWQYWSPWASRYRYRQYLDELRDERRGYVRARKEAMREHRDRYRSARRWWHNPWAESRRRWWDTHSDYGREISQQRYAYSRTPHDAKARDYREPYAGPGAWGPYGMYGDPWSYAPGSWGPYPW